MRDPRPHHPLHLPRHRLQRRSPVQRLAPGVHQGLGTFLKFIFDNSEPGCLDCVNSVYGNGLNPTFVTEKWHLDNATGPYIGGTLVTITAKGLNWPTESPPTISSCRLRQRYNGPVGGPGAPHPHNVDPMSSGNGPPVTGTFYPHQNPKCRWQCFLDEDQNWGAGSNVTCARRG